METKEQLAVHIAHDMAVSLVETIKLVRHVISLKYSLDQRSARIAMTKALIQNAVGEIVKESNLGFDERCDLEDSIYRAILIASSDGANEHPGSNRWCELQSHA